MIKFYSRHSDCNWRARKNENGGTFNFTSQIASSIYTVAFTKCDKSDATIFKSLCSRTAVNYRLMAWHALPLKFVRFLRLANRLPLIQQNPARRSHNVRQSFGKTSGEMARSQPHRFPAMAGQWQMQCRQMSARATCKTTCNMTRNGQATFASQSAQHTMRQPVKHLARWLAEILPARFQP
jgi:hypothetical protein